MIEINLVPDIKQELLRAERVRTNVISIAVVVSLAAVAVVVLLVLWVYGGQSFRGLVLDNEVKDKSAKLAGVEDISNTLTIQNQLSNLAAMHNDKKVDSRVFDVLQAVNPPAPNTISVTNLKIDADTTTISIQGQAASGYSALEVFKKTLAATTLKYTQQGTDSTVPLVTKMSDADRSYGEDANGAKVLRFTITFTYPKQLFDHTIPSLTIQAPNTTNATDSFLGVPSSLFVQKAADAQGSN